MERNKQIVALSFIVVCGTVKPLASTVKHKTYFYFSYISENERVELILYDFNSERPRLLARNRGCVNRTVVNEPPVNRETWSSGNCS